MVKVLLPPKPEVPMAAPGMRISVMPSPHALFLDDYEYYDNLGRDPLQQNNVWSISDPTTRAEKLKEVLKEYPKQKHRRKILFKAAVKGDEAIVRMLVESGVKVHPHIPKYQEEGREGEDGEDDEGIPDEDDPSATPLHAAAANGRLGCVKLLLDGNVDIDIRDEFGRTPLIAAAGGCEKDTMKYLLEQGADPTARSDAESELTKKYFGQYAGANALETVAGQRDIDAVKLLLDHHRYGSTRQRKHQADDRPGNLVTALAIKLAAGGDIETLKFLLEQGAYPTRDEDGKTKSELLNQEERQTIVDATPIAAMDGDLESLRLLLSYQYPSDKDGRLLPFKVPEALHKPFIYGAYHAMTCNKPEKFEYLNQFGLKEHDGMSLDKLPEGQLLNIQHLLDVAAEHGSVDSATLMIEKYGANPNRHRIPSGAQPLYMAAMNNKLEMVRYLLEHCKVDIHLGSGRYATGPTALWIAIQLKSLDCVEFLLRHGGPVDHVDDEILNVTKPMKAVLISHFGERAPIRLETEENTRDYVEAMRHDFQNLNPPYVRLEIGPDDRDWIRSLKRRRSDEELRERGEGARELNEKEKVKTKDLDQMDPRRLMGDYPTNPQREAELMHDDDLLPKWQPAFVPATDDDSD